MDDPSHDHQRRHRRLPRRPLRRRSDAVASVVGTILAVLVLTTLLSIAMGVWVPAMMKSREAAHNQDAFRDLLALKAAIDDQVARATPGDERSTPVTMGFADVPIFVAETKGTVAVDPVGGAVSIAEKNLSVSRAGSSRVVFRSQNSFYLQQAIIYEAGGLLVYQDQGQLVRAAPPVSLLNDSGVKTLTVTLLYLLAENQSQGGSLTVDIRTTLIDTSTESYNWSGGLGGRNIYLNITTQYKDAWLAYYNQSLARAGLDPGITDPGDDIQGDYDYEELAGGTGVSIQFSNIHFLSVTRAIVKLDMKA